MELKTILAIILITATANVTIGAGLGIPVDAKSAASSGYSHGQKDCNGNHDDDDMYITGVNSKGESTGPDHHTTAFMNAFYRGWSDAGCSTQELNDILYPETYSDVNTGIDNSFNNRDSVVQPQSQSAATVQSNSCPSQIINGDCIVGQEQSTDNDFAQASRANN